MSRAAESEPLPPRERVLAGSQVALLGSDAFLAEWRLLVRAAGATLADSVDALPESASAPAASAAADVVAPPVVVVSQSKPAAGAARAARSKRAPIVATSWLVQSLNERVLQTFAEHQEW